MADSASLQKDEVYQKLDDDLTSDQSSTDIVKPITFLRYLSGLNIAKNLSEQGIKSLYGLFLTCIEEKRDSRLVSVERLMGDN
ncbi:hypothetical protein HK097_011015, partial [Rhizophlyctis rosea]